MNMTDNTDNTAQPLKRMPEAWRSTVFNLKQAT
jgi:hypothetical protein